MWGMTCTATENDVDVLLSGYAFRLKILHERGLSLIKKESRCFYFLCNYDDLIGNTFSQFHVSNHFNMQLEMIKQSGFLLLTRNFLFVVSMLA